MAFYPILREKIKSGGAEAESGPFFKRKSGPVPPGKENPQSPGTAQRREISGLILN